MLFMPNLNAFPGLIIYVYDSQGNLWQIDYSDVIYPSIYLFPMFESYIYLLEHLSQHLH